MAITVKCSACQQQFQVRDNLAGKSIVCRECGADLSVPKSRSAAAVDAEEDSGGDYALPQQTKAPAAASGSRKAGSSGSQPVLSRRSSDSLPSGRSASPANQHALWIYLGAGGVLLMLVVLVIKLVGSPPAVSEGDLSKSVSTSTAGTIAPPPVYTPPAANNPTEKQPVQKKQEKKAGSNSAADPDVKFASKKSQQEQPADPAEAGQAAGGVVIGDGGVAWKVKFDPPDEPLELDPEKKIMATIPKNAARDVIFPDCPSSFVALGSNNNPRDVREIRDIQGNRKVGAVRGLVLANALAALSPDGQQFAAWPSGRDQIGVWVVKTEKPRGTITAAGNFTCRLLMFAGNERLIAVGTTDEILVWGMPDGRPERAIALPKIPGVLVAGLSPGGRYLALSHGDVQSRMISVFDVSTGNTAGQIRLSRFPGRVPQCHGLAFSRDGEELAALYETSEESTLFVFRVAGGQLSAHVPFEDSLQALLNSGIWQGGHALQWFPSRKRWLAYGRGVIDREAGKLVWTLPRDKSGSVQLGHVLDDDRLLVIGAEKQDAAVVVREVPSE